MRPCLHCSLDSGATAGGTRKDVPRRLGEDVRNIEAQRPDLKLSWLGQVVRVVRLSVSSFDFRYETVSFVVLEGAQVKARRPVRTCPVGIFIVDPAVAVVGEVDPAAGLAAKYAGAETQLVLDNGTTESNAGLIGRIATLCGQQLRAAICRSSR